MPEPNQYLVCGLWWQYTADCLCAAERYHHRLIRKHNVCSTHHTQWLLADYMIVPFFSSIFNAGACERGRARETKGETDTHWAVHSPLSPLWVIVMFKYTWGMLTCRLKRYDRPAFIAVYVERVNTDVNTDKSSPCVSFVWERISYRPTVQTDIVRYRQWNNWDGNVCHIINRLGMRCDL